MQQVWLVNGVTQTTLLHLMPMLLIVIGQNLILTC